MLFFKLSLPLVSFCLSLSLILCTVSEKSTLLSLQSFTARHTEILSMLFKWIEIFGQIQFRWFQTYYEKNNGDMAIYKKHYGLNSSAYTISLSTS